MSMNTVILTGRAGRDPELRYFESGSAVAHFSLAVDRNTAGAEEPDWFDVEVWGKSAQTTADFVRKGSRVGLEGRLQQQKWTDRATGEKRSKVVVSAYRLELLESKGDRQARQQQGDASPSAPFGAPAQAPVQGWNTAPLPASDDVPF